MEDSVNSELQEVYNKHDRVADLRNKIFDIEHELIFLRAAGDKATVVVLLYHDGYVEVLSKSMVNAKVIQIPPGADIEDMDVPAAYAEHATGKVLASSYPNTMPQRERIDRACAEYILESERDKQQQYHKAEEDHTGHGEKDTSPAEGT